VQPHINPRPCFYRHFSFFLFQNSPNRLFSKERRTLFTGYVKDFSLLFFLLLFYHWKFFIIFLPLLLGWTLCTKIIKETGPLFPSFVLLKADDEDWDHRSKQGTTKQSDDSTVFMLIISQRKNRGVAWWWMMMLM